MKQFSAIINDPIINFDDYAEDFVWDIFFHSPVLTPKFVANKIGVDLISFSGSETQALKMLNALAKSAKDFAFENLPIHSQEVQEFVLSRDLNSLYDFLAYEMSFIIAATTTGSPYELYKVSRSSDKPFVAGLEAAASGLLSKYRVSRFDRVPNDLLRKGY